MWEPYSATCGPCGSPSVIWELRGTIVDPELLRILVAAITVHRLRQAGRIDFISREMQAAIPENVYEPVGVSAS